MGLGLQHSKRGASFGAHMRMIFAFRAVCRVLRVGKIWVVGIRVMALLFPVAPAPAPFAGSGPFGPSAEDDNNG